MDAKDSIHVQESKTANDELDHSPKRRKTSDGASQPSCMNALCSGLEIDRESSDLSCATTRTGSDGEVEASDKDPPLLFRRISSLVGSNGSSPMLRTSSKDKLQVLVTSWESPLGLDRKPSAAGFHLSCPTCDLDQLDDNNCSDSEGMTQWIAHPPSPKCEDEHALREMVRIQEKVKQTVRDQVDASYSHNKIMERLVEASTSS